MIQQHKYLTEFIAFTIAAILAFWYPLSGLPIGLMLVFTVQFMLKGNQANGYSALWLTLQTGCALTFLLFVRPELLLSPPNQAQARLSASIVHEPSNSSPAWGVTVLVCWIAATFWLRRKHKLYTYLVDAPPSEATPAINEGS